MEDGEDEGHNKGEGWVIMKGRELRNVGLYGSRKEKKSIPS